MIIAVFTSSSDQNYLIGSVVAPDNFPSGASGEEEDQAMEDLWFEWQDGLDELPDSDSQFIDWLIANKGFKQPPDDVTYTIITT